MTKKSIVALSAVAALSINGFAAEVSQADMMKQLQMLQEQIKMLETRVKTAEEKNLAGALGSDKELEKRITKLETNVKKNTERASEAKMLANNDNIKWDVNFRTAYDHIEYKHASGEKSGNPDLLTSRLWLGMGYAPNDNNLFKGKLSYMKAFGDTANHSQSNTSTGTTSYNNFDWVTNENPNGNDIKVKEAYWLYMNDTFLGAQVPWTISVGRRPSTDGLGINMREGMDANSPLSHTVNVEFDGLSSKFNLDKVTGIEGMWWKLCTGRGLTNAKPRFQNTGMDYDNDETIDNNDINMYGFIFVPWDNGQYSVWTNWARAENLIGFDKASMQAAGAVANNMDPDNGYAPFATSVAQASAASYYAPKFKQFGDMDLFTIMFKAEGIGDGISDFLDDTRFFASWAQSKTRPKGDYGTGGMLGSDESKTGSSTWIGLNMPCPITEDGRFGIEWNKGSKYWRSVTYAEDTMTGSKVAARGTAWEVYYNKPLTEALNMNFRFTQIKYDYTGSNAFFGDDGAAFDIDTDSATLQGAGLYGDPVKEAENIHFSVTYKF